MAEVKELIKKEPDGSISFGDYTLSSKAKKDDFEYNGDTYSIRTFSEITKLEKNEMLVYESIPGSSVLNMTQKDEETTFTLEGPEDVNITLGMAPDTEYSIYLDGVDSGKVMTNFSGKMSVGVELSGSSPINVAIKKV